MEVFGIKFKRDDYSTGLLEGDIYYDRKIAKKACSLYNKGQAAFYGDKKKTRAVWYEVIAIEIKEEL